MHSTITTDITPTVLDGGNEIILANWPNDKHIIYNVNNDVPVTIPTHPYILVIRSVLCNCGMEAGTTFALSYNVKASFTWFTLTSNNPSENV